MSIDLTLMQRLEVAEREITRLREQIASTRPKPPTFYDLTEYLVERELTDFTRWHSDQYGESSVEVLSPKPPERNEELWAKYETAMRWQGWLQRARLKE